MAITTAYDAPTGNETTVEVTFTSDSPSLTHVRSVNAVFTGGSYDAAKTAERVASVALSVQNKIALGVITAPIEEGE